MPPVKQSPSRTSKRKPPASQNGHSKSGGYAKCDECGAPLDEKQRYCVTCGARRRDKGTPSTSYFATAARRTRRGVAARAPASSGGRAAAVLFFVLLPLAVAIGVLVGNGNGNNDQQIADAIKQLQAGGGASNALASNTAGTATIASDFALDKGYTVELKSLPTQGTDRAAVDAAKQDATSNGASDVGIIVTSDFTVTPAPPASDTYVLYSGQFKSKGEATNALKKLKAKFPDAQVVAVKKSSGEGQLVSKTQYGDVHKVEGFTPSASKVASDQSVVNGEAQKTGKNYVDSQKSLPDVIVVGGSGGGGSSTPGATGHGD